MDFNADEGLEIYFELSKFHNNASYCPSLAPTNLVDYDGCADYLAYLLNAEYVNENDGMSEILTYFVKGYYRKDGTTPADASITAKIDAFVAAYGDDYLADKGYGIFASGIPSIKNYHPTWYDAIFDPDHTGTDIDKAGFPATWNPDLTDVTKVGNLLTTSGNTLITLEDETLSKQLHATSIYGQTFAFAAKDEAWGITYIAIDDFYLNIVKDHLYVNLGLSLNGYETVLILSCDASATHTGFQYSFDVKDVYFGEIAASETLKQAAFSQIATAMASSSSLSSFFAFDAAASQIKIDLASVLNTEKDKIVATLPSVLQPTVEDAFNNLDLDMATEGTTIDGVGTMEFKTA
ncbi:MAG: hypothetical protein HUJ60_06160 [Bacilli bacterium]|nr:hypothetical protein [Bacilli bacterium]